MEDLELINGNHLHCARADAVRCGNLQPCKHGSADDHAAVPIQ